MDKDKPVGAVRDVREHVSGRPTTKIALLRGRWAAGDRIGALQIAARFGNLGDKANAIRRGWDAHNRPAFYRELGRDPAALEAEAITALAGRYGLPL